MEPIQLTITLEDNVLSMSGPLEHPIICYGLLEAAKEIVREKSAAAKARTVHAPALAEVAAFGRKP